MSTTGLEKIQKRRLEAIQAEVAALDAVATDDTRPHDALRAALQNKEIVGFPEEVEWVCRELIARGEEDENLFQEAWLWAAAQGNRNGTNEVLKALASAKAPLPDPEGVLEYLMGQDDWKAVGLIHELGLWETPWQQFLGACSGGRIEEVQKALRKGRPKAPREPARPVWFEREMPLLGASLGGHIEVMQVLITAGYNPAGVHPTWPGSPLRMACESGKPEAVALILKNLSKPDKSLLNQRLQQVVSKGCLGSAKLLLDAGAGLTVNDNVALSLALWAGKVEIANLILERTSTKLLRELKPLFSDDTERFRAVAIEHIKLELAQRERRLVKGLREQGEEITP